MNRGWFNSSVVGIVLLCASCSSMVAIEAKGTRKGEAAIPPHVTYAVFPTGEVDKDPAFSTYARLVARKMDEHGFKESDARTAQLAVYVGYGVTESLSGDMSPDASAQTGRSVGMGPTGMSPGGQGYGAGGYGGGMAASQPSSTVKQFVSQMVVVIGDLPKSRAAGSLVELWRGETRHRGSTSDLPTVAPLLVDANFRHFGETTSSDVTHSFGEEDVKKLREGQDVK